MKQARKITESDKSRLLEYLEKEAEFNIFAIGDLQNLGIETDFMNFWVQEENGQLQGVLLRYSRYFTLYTHDAAIDLLPLIRIANDLVVPGDGWMLSGKQQVISAVRPLVKPAVNKVAQDHFAVCQQPRKPGFDLPLERVQWATPDDAPALERLLSSIEEFGGSNEEEGLRRDIASGLRVTSLVYDGQGTELLSSASYTAQTDSAAMIIGVCTASGVHRGKGLATACVYALVERLFQNGRSAALFYDNPRAGSIYHKMGFEKTGMWTMLHFV